MSTPNGSQEKALDLVGDLLKLIPSTSGIMLALIWGLADDTTPGNVMCAIQIASIVLVAAILIAILGIQFLVSDLQGSSSKGAGNGWVQLCFAASWIAFVGGCVVVLVSLFLL